MQISQIFKNKKVIAVIAVVLALLITAGTLAVIFVSCDGDGEGGKKTKKVVVMSSNKKDETDDGDDYEDGDGDYDDDPYASDDITLDLGYTDSSKYSIDDLVDGKSDVYKLKSYNASQIAVTNWRGVFGSNYYPSEFMGPDVYGRSYTEEMLDLELTRYSEMGLTHVRTLFWSNWAYTGNPDDPWDWESERMTEFYAWCKKLETYGLQVIPMMGWSYSNFLYGGSQYLSEVDYMYPKKYDADGNTIIVQQFGVWYEDPDCEEANRRFSRWVTEAYQAILDHGVTNLNSFLLGNEPHEDGGTATGAFVNYQIDTYTAVHEALKAAGLRDKVTLIGPNQSAPSGRAGLAQAFMDRAPDVFDVYTSHYTPSGQTSVDDIYSDGKTVYDGYMSVMDDHDLRNEREFWLDEFLANGDRYNAFENDTYLGVQTASIILAAMNSGVSGICVWEMFDQLWPDYYGSGGEYMYGMQTDGAIPSLYDSELPYSLYYTYTLFTKYMSQAKSTTYVSEAEDESSGLYIATVQLADGNWSVAVVNMTTDEKDIDVNFEKAMGGKTFYRYRYSAGEIEEQTTIAAKVLTADKGFKNVQNDIIDTIPGGTVVVYSTIANLSD